MTKEYKRILEKIVACEMTRDQSIRQIIDAQCGKTEESTNLKPRLLAFWNLAYSIGHEIGEYEGYEIAKAGKPLGQSAHLNGGANLINTSKEFKNDKR